jgi:type IV pilus assembly protein PilF
MKIFASRALLVLQLGLLSLLAACGAAPRDNTKADKNPATEAQDLQKRASFRLQLAVEYYRQGQGKVALDEIAQALQAKPDLVDAYGLRALIYMDGNDAAAAEENFLHALKLAPNNSELSNNYGWFLCLNGREKQGLAYFEKVLKDPAYPTPGKVYNNAGVCSLKLKDVKSAEAYFKQGFKEQPGNPSINANLAKVYFDRGEYENAKFYIQRVIKEDIFAADVLWLAIKIEKKLGDQVAVNSLGTQLRRRHPNSKELIAFQRGAFDE